MKRYYIEDHYADQTGRQITIIFESDDIEKVNLWIRSIKLSSVSSYSSYYFGDRESNEKPVEIG